MKVEPKVEEEIPQEIQGESTLDNKLELLKFTSQVQSRIKTDISEDFILAKLNEQDKEGIIEMTCNAYFVKKIMEIIKRKATEWEWNNVKKQWTKKPLSATKKDFIQKIADLTFDSYLNKIYMTVILNRNVPNNHMLKILAGSSDEEDRQEIEGMKGKISELMKPNQEVQQ